MDSRATIVDVSTLFSCLTVYQKSGPMKIPLKPAHILLTVIAVLGIEGCAAHTPYRETPVVSLSDEQLIQELASAVQGMGIAINRAQYLMAVHPEPAYVLTSSTTTFSGTMHAQYSTYTMPIGYGTTTYGTASGSVSGAANT